MDLGLHGRVALVTGATRGIGRGIAEALIAEGATVAITGRGDSVVEVAKEIGARGYRFDSGDLGAGHSLVHEVSEELGPPHLYVANTGGPRRDDDALGFSVQEWEQAHRELVISPMTIIQALLPGMREREFGRIVAVSSSAAREPLGGLQLSNANRPGLLAAFKLLAREEAAHGITFNAVLAGRIETERISSLYPSDEARDAAAREEIPAGRLGETGEIGAVATFLCSHQAAYVTGQSVLVDGGLTQSW